MSGSERGNSKLRFLDEKIGPWPLRILGLWRAFLRALDLRRPPQQIRSVRLLKLAGIGDTVLLSALVGDLKAWNPDVHVTMVVAPSNAIYARLLPLVDEVLVVPIKNPLRALSILRRESADLMINADSWARLSALLGALSRARWVIGFQTPGQRRHYADDQLIPHRADKHEIDNDRSLLATLGIPVGGPPLKPPTQPAPPELRGAVIFHLWPGGTKSHLREWPLENWASLLERLARSGVQKFVLTGAPEQRVLNDRFIAALPASLQAGVHNAAGMPMQNTINLLAEAALLISVDTGVMHIGAALGTKVISLHGPSNPRRWGPIGERVQPLTSSQPGAGRLVLGFEYDSDQNFMTGLSIDEVEACARKMLGTP